ncbi:hypothetical protein CPB86DRAFT_356397 [Serendipita vermifera]|nr:hypothetical protein CPB86DRAFT_356397 [Serendipita vermifera]
MIVEAFPYGRQRDHTIPQVCRRWRDLFYNFYPLRVQTFPTISPTRLREDEYYIDYWINLKASRPHRRKSLRIVWIIPNVTGFYRTRLEFLLSKFMCIFPTRIWESIHMVPSPMLANMSISRRMWFENRDAYPTLKWVTISRRLD